MPNKLRGGPLGFFNIHSVAKYQKIKGGPFGKKIFREKSFTEPKKLKGDPLAPLSFLDDVKKLLRKLSRNYKKM